MTVSSDPIQGLIGGDLSAVTFVRDYVQLQFDPPSKVQGITAYTPVTVRCGERIATLGEERFANLVLGLIGKVVRAVHWRGKEAVAITFENGCTLAISLRPEDYVGPEAINLMLEDGTLVVE